MVINDDTYHLIINAFPNVPPEIGCILGSMNDVVCKFAMDMGIPRYDAAVYTPDVCHINQIINEWAEEGIKFCGLAHSHPPTQKSLSQNDNIYITKIMQTMPPSVDVLYFPLVFSGTEMLSFAAVKNNCAIDIRPDHIIIQNKRR